MTYPTLRFDLLHSGTAETETYQLTKVHRLGPWQRPLNPVPAIYGEYRWLVTDARGACLASEGFSPLFAEWQTIAEAREQQQGFPEFFPIPQPSSAAQFLIQRRQVDGQFLTLFQLDLTSLDPGTIAPPPVPPSGTDLIDIMVHGPAVNHIDLLILGDGYSPADKDQFIHDAHRFREVLFSLSPYKERLPDFNLRALFTPSAESGITDPASGIERQTVFASSYNSLGIDRYLLPYNLAALYDTCALVPWDTLVILCNSEKFGGGGLYQQYACLAFHCENIAYLAVHEFAHAFAGLADEYYTAPVTYEPLQNWEFEFWEPNVSTLNQGQVKWQQQIRPATPVPTPWDKQTYEAIMREYEELRLGDGTAEPVKTELQRVSALAQDHLQQQAYAQQIGAFEGARYQATGVYRPEVNCLMFSRHAQGFCQVCRDGIEQAIDRATGLAQS